MYGIGNNAQGVLGINSSETNITTFTQVGSNTTWVSASAFYGQSYNLPYVYALKSDNTLWGWGLNTSGQLGQNDVANYSNPIQIGDPFNPDWKDFSVGDSHVLAIKTDNTAWGWGANTNGQIGDGTSNNRSSPVQVSSVTDANVVEAGIRSTGVAIDSSKKLWAWGNRFNIS